MTDTTTAETDERPLLDRARDAMPGLAVIETALAEVNERLRQARAAPVPEAGVVEHALAAVLTGDPVPDDLGDQVLAIRRQNEAALAEAQVLAALAARLAYRRRDAHAGQADAALRFLAGELDTLLSQARPVLAALGDVSDATAAIEADVVAPWREASALGARYEQIRGAQRIITAASVEPPDQAQVGNRVSPAVRALVLDYGIVKEPDRHYAQLGDSAATHADSQLGEVRVVNGRIVSSSHTDRPAAVRPWATGDTLTDLRFTVREDVEPWVPSIRELISARTEHQERQRADAEAADPPTRAISRMTDTRRTLPPASPALLNRLAEDELSPNRDR